MLIGPDAPLVFERGRYMPAMCEAQLLVVRWLQIMVWMMIWMMIWMKSRSSFTAHGSCV
jgi:hypothetical protein